MLDWQRSVLHLAPTPERRLHRKRLLGQGAAYQRGSSLGAGGLLWPLALLLWRWPSSCFPPVKAGLSHVLWHKWHTRPLEDTAWKSPRPSAADGRLRGGNTSTPGDFGNKWNVFPKVQMEVSVEGSPCMKPLPQGPQAGRHNFDRKRPAFILECRVSGVAASSTTREAF